MRYIVKVWLAMNLIFILLPSSYANPPMSTIEAKQWIQEALHYGFDMQTKDYSKYMSTDYIEHIDGKVFDFKQWLHHMNSLKSLMKSYELTFDEIVVEGNQIATSYVVHATKKDGSKIDIRIVAIFKLKDDKIIYCDELTHIISGKAEKGFASQN